MGHSSGPAITSVLDDLGESLSSPGLSVPVGTGRTLRAPAGGRGRSVEAGPGGSRTAHCGGRDLRSSSWWRGGLLPGRGSRAGSWRPHSCSLSTCRRQTARPGSPHLRLQPRRGRRSPSPARAEPSHGQNPARHGPRAGRGRLTRASAAGSSLARAAPPLQVRARSWRRKVLGSLLLPAPGPVPPGAAGCSALGLLHVARHGALRLHRWSG